MFDSMEIAMIETNLRRTFPTGLPTSYAEKARPKVMIEAVVNQVAYTAELGKKRLHIALEITRNNNEPPTVCSVVIQIDETTIVPVTLSNNVARLNGKPVFLDHPDGAVNLARAILDEIDNAIAAETSREMAALRQPLEARA